MGQTDRRGLDDISIRWLDVCLQVKGWVKLIGQGWMTWVVGGCGYACRSRGGCGLVWASLGRYGHGWVEAGRS